MSRVITPDVFREVHLVRESRERPMFKVSSGLVVGLDVVYYPMDGAANV